MANTTWQRNSGDLATRIEAGDISGWINHDIVVEQGTHAIILKDGDFEGVVTGDKQRLESLWDRLRGRMVSAVLIDTGEQDMTLRVEPVFTKDPLRLGVQVRLGVAVGADEASLKRFYINQLKGAQNYTATDLGEAILPELQDAMNEFSRRYTVRELDSSTSQKSVLEDAVRTHLEPMLTRSGVRLLGVRGVRYLHERLNKLTQQREDLLLQVSEAEAKLDGRRRLFDVVSRDELQALVEESERFELYEKRAALNERMRQAVSLGKMDEVSSEAQFAKFLDSVDREKILREEERAKLLFEVRTNQQDRERAWVHVLARLDVEQRYELLLLEAARHDVLTTTQADAEAKRARAQVDMEWSLVLVRAQGKINVQKAKADYARESARVAESDARIRMLEDAKAEAEVSRLEREKDRLDADLGIVLLEKMKRVRHQDESVYEVRRLETKQRETEIEIAHQRALFDMEMQRARLTQDYELARIKALGEISPDAIFAFLPSDRAQLLKELQETRDYKDMSAEQLEMLMAGKSPAVAQALSEKYKAAVAQGSLSTEQTALYERLLAAQAVNCQGQ